MKRKILITGAAGFIGFHLSQRLLGAGDQVTGLDNLNDYYDVELKKSRLALLEKHDNFDFARLDISGKEDMKDFFARLKPDMVIHLAAQAGVRYSIVNPHAYIESNLVGFLNVLEGCRHNKVKHLVFASSSSVYGANTLMPFSIHHNVDHPVSLYAATKKSNELMAHSYASLYNMPCTGLRFFTVYGPWGRPDMALFKFTKSILANEPIDIYNRGNMQRDFTYIDDIVEGVVRVTEAVPVPSKDWNGDHPDPAISYAPYRLFNIGNNNPVLLLEFVGTLEKILGKKAKKNLLPMQAGDVMANYADVDDLTKAVGFKPATTIENGIRKFIDWYRQYYKIAGC